MNAAAARAPSVEFWFEFASTYSYLAIMRIEARAAAHGVAVRWRPFLLGPIFAAQGWDTSPFLVYAAKGRHMWRDLERRAAACGLPFSRAAPFPARTVEAARRAIAALETPAGPAFCRAVAQAIWGEGRDPAAPGVLDGCARAAGLDPVALAARAEALRPVLRATVEEAAARGVFGAPSFFAGDELFWGEDRMEDALSWAATGRLVAPPPA